MDMVRERRITRLWFFSISLAFTLGLLGPSPASAAIGLRAAASTNLNGSALTLTIAKPTGTLQGDVMVAGTAFRPNTATITPPGGWTLVRRQDNSLGTANSLAVYYKVAGASEPASYTWTFSTSTGSAGGIMSFSGVDNTTPINVEAGASTTASTTSFTAPSVTTTVANTMVVTHHAFSSSERFTPPTGMTEAFDVASNAAPGCCGEAIEGNFVLQAAIGATGTKTATVGGNADNGNMHTLALRPVVCAAVTDATTVAASAQSTQATLYWSSSNPVLILRKAGASVTEAPANGVTYNVGDTIGGSTVVYNGSAAETSTLQTGLTNGTTYSYKVFAKSGTCYAAGTGTEVTARPVLASTGEAWSYMLAGGSILKPGIAGEGAIYTSSNSSRIVSLSTTDGTHSWAPVTTTAAIQGYLTWLPIGQAGVRSVQSGTATMPVGATATTQTVNVGAAEGFAGVTDLERSVLFFSLKVSSVDPGDGQVRGQLASTTNIQFTRANDTSLSAVTIRWYVVEFYGGVLVQRGTASVTNAGNVTITTPVDRTRSFVLTSCTVASGDTTYNSDDYIRAQLTSSTNLELVHSTTAAKTCEWQVIEYSGASVQRNIGTLASTATTSGSIGISSVDLTKSFVHVTWKTSGNGTGANFLRARLTSATTIVIDRAVSGTTIDYAWEAVSFTDGTTVRSGTEGFTTSSVGPETDALSPAVDTTRSVPFTSAYQRGGQHAYTADDNVGPGWFTVTITNSTTVTLERQITGSVAANAGWFVIEFPSGTTANTAIGGDQGGKAYSVNAATGATNWEVTLTGADAVQAGVSAQLRDYSDAAFQAAFTTDVIFVATRNTSSLDNKVFALRADTGGVLWTFNSPVVNNVDKIVGQPWVDYARNRLYVASRAGVDGTQLSLWVLNTLNGSLVQSFALSHVETSPTLSFDGLTLYVGNMNGSLYAINAASLTLKWTNLSATGTAIKGVIWEDVTTAGRLYFVTADGNLWCIQDNGAGSSLVWKTATPIAGATTPLPLGALYTGSSDGTLHKINLSTGVDELQFTVGDGTKTVGDASTETGSELFVGTTEKLYKISPVP